MVFRSTAVRKREQRRCRSGGLLRFGMAGVRFRGAEHHPGGAMLIILFTGTMVAQQISTTWFCCAVITTGRCTTPSGVSRSARIGRRCSIHPCRSIRINSRSAGTAHPQQPEPRQSNTSAPGTNHAPVLVHVSGQIPTPQIPTPQIPAPQIPALRTRASVAEGDTTSIARNSPAYRGYSSTGRVLIALKIHDAA